MPSNSARILLFFCCAFSSHSRHRLLLLSVHRVCICCASRAGRSHRIDLRHSVIVTAHHPLHLPISGRNYPWLKLAPRDSLKGKSTLQCRCRGPSIISPTAQAERAHNFSPCPPRRQLFASCNLQQTTTSAFEAQPRSERSKPAPALQLPVNKGPTDDPKTELPLAAVEATPTPTALTPPTI